MLNCSPHRRRRVARLNGTNPLATAPVTLQGEAWTAIEARFGLRMGWGQSFDDAFQAVQGGGDGTAALVGIQYPGGQVSHVLVMTNEGGTVGMMEAQVFPGSPDPEVITSAARADQRYNATGQDVIGFGIIPGSGHH